MHKSKEERERELEKLEEETPEKCYKLRFPQPLRPAEPGQLVQGLQLNALKYLVLAAFACYICGRLHFGYFFGVLAILGGETNRVRKQGNSIIYQKKLTANGINRWIGILCAWYGNTTGIGLAVGKDGRIKNGKGATIIFK